MFTQSFSYRAWTASILLGCSLYQASCGTLANEGSEVKSEFPASNRNNLQGSELAGLETARQKEREALLASASRQLDINTFWKNAGYTDFPSRIFLPKSNERAPGARYLTSISIAIYEQALAGKVTGDWAYYDNSLRLINKIVETDLNFANDPNLQGCAGDNDASSCTNDNRFLAAAWALSSMARGAHILDGATPAGWQQKQGWTQAKAAFITWIERTSRSQNNPKVKPWVQLIQDRGTMTWVSPTDSNGSTNRTFALLEAQMRVAELRGGQLLQNRSMRDIFADFKKYLRNYFTQEETCLGDPSTGAGRNLICLPNKDKDRNDTYHPLMGLASVGYIMDIGQRYGLSVDQQERDMILKGYHWGADWNTARPSTGAQGQAPGIFRADQINSGIDVWETAFRFYSAAEMGPLCVRDRDRNRSLSKYKAAALAWGYGALAEGF